MKKIKLIYIVFAFFLILKTPVFADDEIDEIDVTPEEISQILTVTTDVVDVPDINSRHAVVYDRVSRKDIVWKDGRRKM